LIGGICHAGRSYIINNITEVYLTATGNSSFDMSTDSEEVFPQSNSRPRFTSHMESFDGRVGDREGRRRDRDRDRVVQSGKNE
jgi:hypothetical protein